MTGNHPAESAHEIETAFAGELRDAADDSELSAVESRYLGKKGVLRAALRSVGAMPAESRAAAGRPLVELERRIRAAIDERRAASAERLMGEQLATERLDVTLPGRSPQRGAAHPLTLVENQCLELLRALGFRFVEGPEVDSAFNNFDALNIPPYHPARELQDTFWLTNGALLRSHTTTVQARVLASHAPLPVKVAASGRVYRNEANDSTHTAMFHQLEGIWVEHGLTLADLKGVLRHIVAALYPGPRMRFKPKYYPYTEPSIGLDLACTRCSGAGCGACHFSGWVTVIGAGMIHPAILERFDYPQDATGFAFGGGTSRMAAQWAGLSRIKQLYEPSARAVRQMHGVPR